ncbi:MAG: mandelate racemase/muconate lactonizing enzyme family protein [Halanaeroarchaeum sp.]
MNVACHPFSVGLDPALETSDGRLETRNGWIVQIEAAAGGFGEAAPLPGFTESPEITESALGTALEALEADALPDAYGAVAAAPAARHAVATAILDDRARSKGDPLYRELGGREPIEDVPVNATVGDGPPTETLAAVEDALERGFETVKVKVGARSLEADLQRIDRVIESVDRSIDLRIDVNGAWDAETARSAIDRIPTDRISLLEQPLPAADLEGHRGLRGRVPIGLDESLRAHPPADVIRSGAADAVVLKPMALGGPDVARALAREALRRGVEPIVSNTIETAVGRTTALHVAASLPRRSPAGLATADRLSDDVAADPTQVEDGRMRVPGKPGLGIGEVRTDA